MMSTQDYRKLATALKRARHTTEVMADGEGLRYKSGSHEAFTITLGEIIAELHADNPRFNEALFREATK